MTPEIYTVRWGKPSRPWFAAMIRVSDHPRFGRVLPFFLTREGQWCNVAHGHQSITGRRYRSERTALAAAKRAGIPKALAA